MAKRRQPQSSRNPGKSPVQSDGKTDRKRTRSQVAQKGAAKPPVGGNGNKPRQGRSSRKSAGKRPPRRGTVTVTFPDGKTLSVPRYTEAGEVFERAGLQSLFPIVACKFRHKVASLQRPVDQDGELEAVDLGSRDGQLIYRRSLTFVLIHAVSELFPDLRVYMNHSVDQGYYGELYSHQYHRKGPVIPSRQDIEAISARMREIIERDELIERHEYELEKAIDVFRKAGMEDKVKLLEYSPPGLVSVYKLRDSINHFYGQLAPTTGCLKTFELVALGPGFVLRFPGRQDPTRVPPHVHQEALLNVLFEYERWMRILEWRTVAQLNAIIDEGRVREYVLIAEALHEKRIAAIADSVSNHPRKPRVILLSGPSSSGKTTTTKRLMIQLRVNGLRPVPIGLDDFFVDRDKTPRDEKGEYDFEAFEAIDIPRLQECIRGLLRGEKVRLPRFDFPKGKSVPGRTLQVEEDQILILEGIHALNDRLLPTIPDGLKFKIYASPLTHLNIDDHNRIPTSDLRILRRLVRDFNYRGYDAVATIKRWPSVRRGEEINIFPYQQNADVIFNSSLPYEFSVLKQYAIPVLKSVERSEPEYSEAARLIKFLVYFRDIKPDFVPRHSLLREFIGGSCFTY